MLVAGVRFLEFIQKEERMYKRLPEPSACLWMVLVQMNCESHLRAHSSCKITESVKLLAILQV